ncbi:syntaxin-16 isoform X2 [Leptidea sinapis]|uniref:syntaxin-16 isoform X2 n=1 Tax=Leptidea sinapis TaxID=189913 RepID=UPI0021241838|nr:syntaxin-16 isoform X2 [Leptidea sinapis]
MKMVSRSLTEVYVLMRNNAIHSRQIFTEQSNDHESVGLMSSNNYDVEGGLELRSERSVPPPWSDSLEEVHYIISRLRTKIAELQSRHELQIRRPALDDSGEQQHIERLATDIGKHFAQAHARVTAIRAQVRCENKTEEKVGANVVLALVTILQDLSITFRMSQSNYLKSITSREERSNAYFDLPNFEELSLQDNLLPGLTSNQTDLLFSLPSTSNYTDDNQHSINQKQLLLMQEENTQMIAEREQEVNKIVRSIVDLNDIFKDLAHMVHEQGSILDRIDYNIEQTEVQVHEGYKQLQRAERFQRKNRTMNEIIVLSVIIL